MIASPIAYFIPKGTIKETLNLRPGHIYPGKIISFVWKPITLGVEVARFFETAQEWI